MKNMLSLPTTPNLTTPSQVVHHLPDPQELRLLPRGAGLRLHLEAVDVGNGDDRGSHVPGEPHEGAESHEDAHPEQVQMVASSLLQGQWEEGSCLGSLFPATCWGGVGETELSQGSHFVEHVLRAPRGLLHSTLRGLPP